MPTAQPRKSRGYRSDVDLTVDAHVGARMKLRRTLLGMSQTSLANALGVTFQQVQKYERGGNRVSASRLHDMCRVLDVPVSFFFDGLDVGGTSSFVEESFARREILELARGFAAIESPKLRRTILELTKAIASATPVEALAILDGDAPRRRGRKAEISANIH